METSSTWEATCRKHEAWNLNLSMGTEGGRERRWGLKKKLILQKQIQFQTLNKPLILAGGSLLLCLDEQIYCKTKQKTLVCDCMSAS